MKHILDNYPNAKPFSQVASQVHDLLKEKGVELDQSVVAASICSDEVNNSYLKSIGAGGDFFLGGLAGLPHTGLTGMTAFSHHIGDNGASILVYGPHIGVDNDGTVGNVLRQGQAKSSNCCGALKLGLSRLNSGTSLDTPQAEDVQQYYVEKVLVDNKDKLPEGADQLKKATDVTYVSIDKDIRKIADTVKKEFHGKGIVFLGGILINTDTGSEDYFDLRSLEYQAL